MNLYYELLKKPVFTIADVEPYFNNQESARSAVKRLIKKGLSVKIRNNMYTCISGETEAPLANRYQIASAITPTSCISHHTAMEYYGTSDQIFYEVYVSTETLFNEFEFDGYNYRCIISKCQHGVESLPLSGGIRITDKERTVIDSLNDMDKISGIEEVLANIEGLSRLNESHLLHYLDYYGKQFLYQKAGFILSPYKSELLLSDDFFEICHQKAGASKRYLTKECTNRIYVPEWKLVVPEGMYQIKNGGNQDASI